MKIIKNLLLLALLFCSIPQYSNAYNVDTKTETIFSTFVNRLDNKYWTKDKITFLNALNNKINQITDTRSLNTRQEKFLYDLILLSNEEIFSAWNIIDQKHQQWLESLYLQQFKNKLKSISVPSYVSKLVSSERKLLLVSDKQEYISNNSIKKLVYSTYNNINSNNYRGLLSKSWYILVMEWWATIFVESGKEVKKIPYSQAYKYTKWLINSDQKYFQKWNNYYSYNFSGYRFIEDKYGFYIKDLESNWIILSESIIFIWSDKKYNFVTQFNEVVLISKDIIYWVTDKKKFLENLSDDKRDLWENTNTIFRDLKEEIEELTKNTKHTHRIQKVYAWILNELEYTKNFNINDKRIFSWILSYKNKNGVCEWYVKLAAYALMFAWVSGSEVIRWDVIDAQDFPEIWHAWLKIWNKYYDPTFDDPLWSTTTKTFDQYQYYSLPKDLLYVNRYDAWNTPEKLNTTSLKHRKQLVNERLSLLADKYDNYLLLNWVKFNKSVWLTPWEIISINSAKNFLPYREVVETPEWQIYFYHKGDKKNITNLRYYQITDENIWGVLQQLNYSLEWLYLFKWKTANKESEYRLGFEVTIK